MDVGKVHQVLIEGYSRRSNEYLQGRNTANKVVVFPARDLKKGEYVNIFVESCTGATLVGNVVA
jgi:tRNA-2-methylthio-N6-dimethylallyladenosine synthase